MVRFESEDRPDKGHKDFMRKRVNKVIVETKTQNDDQFHPVRTYTLNYFDENVGTKEHLGTKTDDKEDHEGINNEFKASFLTSVQETGTDGETTLPPVTFKYKQYRMSSQGFHGGEIYLSHINNGYGGISKFAYQAFEQDVFTPYYNHQGKMRRVRVIEKYVQDNVADKAYRESYTYGQSKAFAERYRDGHDGAGASGTQFLGHSNVRIRKYDFDGRLLSNSESYFHQTNESEKCLEAHPAKGRPSRQVVYRGDSDDIAQETRHRYKYRLNGEDGLDPTQACDRERINQPYFLYLYDTMSIAREPQKDGFIPSQFVSQVPGQPRFQINTLQRTLNYDEYGNPKLAVNYGEVDNNGFDMNENDNRYSYSYYLTDGEKWIKGLPYLSYSSNSPDCGPDSLNCQ